MCCRMASRGVRPHKEIDMAENPLREIKRLGQSIWLDHIERELITSGRLRRMIDEDGLAGLTSNPAIFEKAMSQAGPYDAAIRARAGIGRDAKALYEVLALEDVQAAADVFAPVYASSRGEDGYVSLEVSPHLANDSDATIAEARRLWRAFDRPNAMIKVPATRAGLGAIRALLFDGINVNVTLLFGLTRYAEVVDAFLDAMEARAASGASVENLASVASFFLSRIDTLIDAKLPTTGTAAGLRGQAAIAAARLAYRHYRHWTGTERWRRLVDAGARPQRLLWASTSTKNPGYSDVKYVEALIGRETINTLPLETVAAYRDHGRPALRLEENREHAEDVLDALREIGLPLDEVADQLERDGVRKFSEPFDRLIATLDRRLAEAARVTHPV